MLAELGVRKLLVWINDYFKTIKIQYLSAELLIIGRLMWYYFKKYLGSLKSFAENNRIFVFK